MGRKDRVMLPESEYSRLRQPYTNIACQTLLSSHDGIHNGWLKKKKQKRRSQYRKYYTVLHKGCAYLYDDGKSEKPSKTFSLYGYQRVDIAPEIQQQPYAFRIVKENDGILFAVDSERELNYWLQGFEDERRNANEIVYSYSSIEQGSTCPLAVYDEIQEHDLGPDFNELTPRLVPTNQNRYAIAIHTTMPAYSLSSTYENTLEVPPPLPPRRSTKVRSEPMPQTSIDANLESAVALSKEAPRSHSDQIAFRNQRIFNLKELQDLDRNIAPDQPFILSVSNVPHVCEKVELRNKEFGRDSGKTDIRKAKLYDFLGELDTIYDETYPDVTLQKGTGGTIPEAVDEYDYVETGLLVSSASSDRDTDDKNTYDSKRNEDYPATASYRGDSWKNITLSHEEDDTYDTMNQQLKTTGYRRCRSQHLIPEALRRQDHHSVQIYHKCLQEGFERKKKIRIIVIGKEKSGKSCFVRRLLKEGLTDVSTTNKIDFHKLKCRANADEEKWFFEQDRTYEDYVNARLLKACVEISKRSHQARTIMDTQEHNPKQIDTHNRKSTSVQNTTKNLNQRFNQTKEKEIKTVLVGDLPIDFYDVIDAPIEEGDIASIEILDISGDEENFNNYLSFIGHEVIYVITTNINETAFQHHDNDCGLKCLLDSVRLQRKIPCTGKRETFEPPIIVVGTHKDQFEGSSEEYLRRLKSVVKCLDTNPDTQLQIRKLFVVSNTEDPDDTFDEFRRDIVSNAKTMTSWNKQIPLRWIHLEKALHQEVTSDNPFISKRRIKELALTMYVSIEEDDEIENFLNHHNDIGTLIYDKDRPDVIILDQQWLANAFNCVLSADKCEKDLKSSKEWQNLQQNGYLSHKLIDGLFKNQPENIQQNKEHIIDIMETSNLIVRAKSRSERSDHRLDYYLLSSVKKIAINTIEDVFFRCEEKSSCLCLEFEFLTPGLFSQIMIACIHNFTVANGPSAPSGKQHALYQDIGIFNLDDDGCEKLLIARYKNVIQIQIWKWSRAEAAKRSYSYIRENIVEIVKKVAHDRMFISYKLKVKCKYTDYETLDGMIDLKIIKPQGQYFCEEHGASHDAEEVYYDWIDHTEVTEITVEQFNATRMAIVVVDILCNVLYDMCLQDIGSVRPRLLCDITYLYAELRKDNKHVPSQGYWGGNWINFPSSAVNVGDDIERIRLVRNDMQHLSSFAIDNQTFYQKHNMIKKLLVRVEGHNNKGTFYSDQLKRIAQSKLTSKDLETYKTKIVSEFPRIELKPSFEVKEGDGCTLECKIVVPLPDGASVFWVKEEDKQDTIIDVNDSTKTKYRGGNLKYPSLNILSTRKEDEGHYSFRIRYPENSAESGGKLFEWPKTFLHVHS